MTKLFLDIESAPNMEKEEFFAAKHDIESNTLTNRTDPNRYWKYAAGALNPYEGKVIFIAYKISPYGYIRHLKEWEDGEEVILEKLYNVICKVKQERLEFVGHNICGFDLPFLYGRMLHHKIDTPKRLYYYMQKTASMDFLQMHLPLNDFHIKGLRHDALARAYGLPIKETTGDVEYLHYFRGEFEKIVQYSEREFIYADLYNKMIKDGMVSKKVLMNAIKENDISE
ncbi:MAG: hypothetical protein K8823_1379 [Cenarchaeum symbiont of Oopsacas minuta]|nr:hypothetical protein [Cenarchaeum symbiont of Oopsacas minuta]